MRTDEPNRQDPTGFPTGRQGLTRRRFILTGAAAVPAAERTSDRWMEDLGIQLDRRPERLTPRVERTRDVRDAAELSETNCCFPNTRNTQAPGLPDIW